MKLYLKEKSGEWKFYEDVKPSDLSKRNIEIHPRASVGEGAIVGEGASVGKGASVGEGASVGKGASVGEWASVGEGAIVGEGASVGKGASVGEWAIVGARASVGEGARVGARARVNKSIDCVVIGPIGSRDAFLTGYRHEGDVWIGTGCFLGPIKDFREAVKKTHGENIHGKDYTEALRYIEARLKLAKDSTAKGGV